MSDPVTYAAVPLVTEETGCSCRGYAPPSSGDVTAADGVGRCLFPAGGAGAALVSRRHPAGQLAADNRIGSSTAHRYPHDGVEVLVAAAPGLRGALLAARAAGHPHVTVDGTLVRTDRVRAPGPTARGDRPERWVSLWWSGKHAHSGNVQVIAAPKGWPIWTSGVRPGREHDTTALRAHPEALPLLAEWTDEVHAVLADLGYEGERAALTTPSSTRPAAG